MTTPEPLADESARRFRFTHSDSFVELLERLRGSLFVSTYQAGKLIVLRPRDGRLSMLLRTFDKAMGLALDAHRLAIATTWKVWTLYNSPEIAARLGAASPHDACYLPRSAHITGAIDAHEIAWGGSELWVVNTLYSCLCTLESPYSFLPRWKPSFVSRLAREDRCHLNGLAIEADRPRYVTLFAHSDTAEGWRAHKKDGGCLVDVLSGEVILGGLSMPHSPRLHAGKLWVLDSGRGRMLLVDRQAGRAEPVIELDGYLRGLCFLGDYAFVGLSKVREANVFGGVPITDKPGQRSCGIAVVDLRSGQPVAHLNFEGEIAELFDVQILSGIRNPEVVGLQKETVQRAKLIGPERPIEGGPRIERTIGHDG